MIQKAGQKKILELYSHDDPKLFFIPRYQREYVWGKWNWEQFFDDITDANIGHFLGSIIYINKEGDSMEHPKLELIDGQQRMTTTSLFLGAIYKSLRDRINNPTDDETVERVNLKNRLWNKKHDCLALTPSVSGSNLSDYKYTFNSIIGIGHEIEKPKSYGNRRISKCYRYFYDRLNEKNKQDEYLFTTQDIQNLLRILNNSILVAIEVKSHSDAFTLFETLNNRGVPLSAIDLIKNNLLAELDKQRFEKSNDQKERELDNDFSRWQRLLKNLSDEYKNQERFVRQYYNAFKVNKSTFVEKQQKATRSSVINIYDELIKRNPTAFFEDLYEASSIYKENLLYSEMEDLDSDIKSSLKDLDNVNGVDGYMLLMFVSKQFRITNNEKKELIKFLCNYFIRRSVTDFPPTRDLTNLFMDLIEKLSENDSYSFELIENFLTHDERCSDNTKFEEKLRGKIYEENVNATRYLLAKIEESTFTKETERDFWKKDDKNKFIWTIEHVFPQGKNIKEHWVQMIANGDKVNAKSIQETHVHKIGNLTLTGFNSNLSDKSLEEKQNRKDKKGEFIGFKNGLKLNEKLADVSVWTKENIDSRTDLLVNKCLLIFEIRKPIANT